MQHRTMREIVRDQHPLVLGPDATVQEASAAMRQRRVGAVLVVDDDMHLLGIFTGRDALSCLAEDCHPRRTKLKNAMKRDPTTLPPGAHAEDALRLFEDAGFRHLPVVDQGRVVGIVSRYDFRADEHRRQNEETGFFEILR
ncbi:CBS domain-containing protein [Humitalea sp. 24SJ18S-53]|uniref:CBS domain-containing protein n=1 Tax=Humitalea sp. 24SJ18S-53 TaxID=3422307 RepID=UPI003D67D680